MKKRIRLMIALLLLAVSSGCCHLFFEDNGHRGQRGHDHNGHRDSGGEGHGGRH